ncbi:MAG: hypothetical protein M0004_07415 [Actinomycetota bacterium]|nr:hypothetical protein [Actinomycetota bacterium]
MGVTPFGLFLACACAIVNFGLVDTFKRHADDVSRRSGPPVPRPRPRRRRTLADLAAAGANAPP